MTSDQRFTITIALLSLVFAALSTALALLVRTVMRWQRIEDRLADLTEDMTKLVQDKDQTHREMLGQMREDRNATNERLTYLERSAWPWIRGGGPPAPGRYPPGRSP